MKKSRSGRKKNLEEEGNKKVDFIEVCFDKRKGEKGNLGHHLLYYLLLFILLLVMFGRRNEGGICLLFGSESVSSIIKGEYFMGHAK